MALIFLLNNTTLAYLATKPTKLNCYNTYLFTKFSNTLAKSYKGTACINDPFSQPYVRSTSSPE